MQQYNNPVLIRPAQEMPRRIGIIGAGTIGPDIGYYLKSALPELNLVLIDISREALDRAIDRIHAYVQKGLARGKLTPAQVDHVAGRHVHAGPFFVLNMSNGNPIIIETNSLQAELEGPHYRPAEIFRLADDTAGKLKDARHKPGSAKGNNSGHPRIENNSGHPRNASWEEKWDTQGKWKTIKPGESVAVPEAVDTEIRERLLGVLFSQTVDILDRDIGTAADLELGCLLAFAFRQGPLELMRTLGEQESERILTKFTRAKPGMPGAQRPLRAYQDFYRFILVDELNGVKIITLRRPEALNALHDDMTDEILAVLKQYEDDSQTSGFVITGYGGAAFSAGADIGRFPSMLEDGRQCIDYARICSRLLVYLDTCRKPVVAALNGMALGGGLELVIRCHGIVAVENAWLQFPEITLGIAPGLGGMVIPYRRWPAAAATFHTMLLKAEKMTAAQAVESGIVDNLADNHTALLPGAVRLVRELADKPHTLADTAVSITPPAVGKDEPLSFTGQRLSATVSGIIRRAIVDAAAAASLDEALEVGYGAFGRTACTAAAREGISAFIEKRKPDFTLTG